MVVISKEQAYIVISLKNSILLDLLESKGFAPII